MMPIMPLNVWREELCFTFGAANYNSIPCNPHGRASRRTGGTLGETLFQPVTVTDLFARMWLLTVIFYIYIISVTLLIQ